MYSSKKLSDQFLLFLQASFAHNGHTEDARDESGISFIGYLQKRLDSYVVEGRTSAASKLRVTLKIFKGFLEQNGLLKNGDLTFSDIDEHLLSMFEKDMKRRFLSSNTTSFYMRILRSNYHKGIEAGLYFTFIDPFRVVFTGVSKTRKRALTEEELLKIINIKLPKRLSYTRDLFLFSLYTRGMSFIDMAELKKDNISKGEIRYYRSKTGQLIRITIEPCIQTIIDRYHGLSGTDHIFPILFKHSVPIKYNTSLKNFNNHLVKISELLGIDHNITSYVARHSWATMAKRGGVPISTISECMGHTSEKTTQIYLSSIEQKSIDEANRLVIHSLNQRWKKSGN